MRTRIGHSWSTKAIARKRKPAAGTEALLKLVLGSLDDDKAEDVVTIDLRNKSAMADYLVIASGRSTRQVGSMADHLMRKVKTDGFGSAASEGMPQNDWVLVDAGDVIVHLFRPEVRAFYNIEKMWSVTLPEERAAV